MADLAYLLHAIIVRKMNMRLSVTWGRLLLGLTCVAFGPQVFGQAPVKINEVAAKIVVRRQKRKFKNLAELSSLLGVSASVLNQRKSRILF